MVKLEEIYFGVFLNGTHLCDAGVGQFGVLMATLTWVRRNPNRRPKNMRKIKWCKEELTLDVQGTQTSDSIPEPCKLDWLHEILKAGDEIRIVVKSTGE